MTFIIIASLALSLVYAGYLLSKIGDGTVWAPLRLRWYVLPLIWLLFLLLPWAGQGLIHYAVGFAGTPPDQFFARERLPFWFILTVMVGPLLETAMLGALYAISRMIPPRFRPDVIFIVATGLFFIFMHKGQSSLLWGWYFTGFAAQAWLYVFLLARAGHVKAWLVISAGHGLANIGIMAAAMTTAALHAKA